MLQDGDFRYRETLEKVDDFLHSYNMHPEDVSMENLTSQILVDMENGLSGKRSSLPMLPTYIEIEREIPSNRPVIVLDAGGTNLRIGLVYFDNEKRPVIENITTGKMPGSDREVTGEDFFSELAMSLRPYLGESDRIGFCFSYPTEMKPDKDGRVLKFSKEIKITGIIGKPIGKGLTEAMDRLGLGDGKKVVILNDTVATLLAGRCIMVERIFDGYIGFILGTGTNCCYIEKNENIGKLEIADKSGYQIINVEAGSFSPESRGLFEIEADKKTINPGDYKLEKMIAGRYFGMVCTEAFRKAVADGLINCTAIRDIDLLNLSLETVDVNDFLLYPYDKGRGISKIFAGMDEKTKIVLGLLFLRLVERASKITASVLSAASIKSGRGLSPLKPILIVIEGTTYHCMRNLKQNTEYYLKKYLTDTRSVYFETSRVDNATLIGAAVAGLTN